MHKTATLLAARAGKSRAGLRNVALFALFAAAQFALKLLDLRRNHQSWLLFRLLLGSMGAALVILPLAVWSPWLFSVVGLAMFLVSILLPSAKTENRIDEKARELGAPIVVNGGAYQPGNGAASPVRLFIGPEHIWALDSKMQPLVVIPAGAISSLHTEKSVRAWVVRVSWLDHCADFQFRGILGEHFARIAEANLRSVVRPCLSVAPRTRAASA